MKLLVRKQFNRLLIPLYNSDGDKLKECRLKDGEDYEIEITRKRNPDFHKKFFGLLNLAYDNQDTFTDFEDLRAYLTCKAGYYHQIETPNGYMIRPKSISFAKMDDIEFDGLYHSVINAICKFIDVQAKEIENELINYM